MQRAAPLKPLSVIPLLEAVAMASSQDTSCVLQRAIADAEPELSVMVSTSDPSPTLSIFETATRPEHLLADRTEHGPEEWDYSFAVPARRDRLELLLECGGRTASIALAPWQIAAIRTFGWGNLGASRIPACVHRWELESALDALDAGATE